MKVLPTYFDGIEFRSRTEARWAVFLKALEVEYHYEPEGYATEAGPYLPDFWLPKQDCFMEIKGQIATKEESAKAGGLAMGSGKRVVLFHNPPIPPSERFGGDAGGGTCFFQDGGIDEPFWWCECVNCGRLGIEFDGRADRICREPSHSSPHGDKGYNAASPKLLNAYAVARSERFGT